MKRRSILLLLVVLLAASVLAIFCASFLGRQPNVQIKIAHDPDDIPGTASHALDGGFDPYFVRVNLIPASSVRQQAEKR